MLRCSEAGAEPTHDHPIPVVIPRREISDMMRRALFAGAAIVLAQAWQADVVTAATIIERTLPASNQPGSRARQYTIAVPDNFETGTPVPVVMVLHGCLQTERRHDPRHAVRGAGRSRRLHRGVSICDQLRPSSEQRNDRTAGGSGSTSTSTKAAASRAICGGSWPTSRMSSRSILTAAMWSACHQAPPWL